MKRIVKEHFDSIDSLINTIMNRPKNESMRNANASTDGSVSFTQTSSLKEAIDLLKNGYFEPLDKLKKVDMNKSHSGNAIKYSNEVVGHFAHVPNAIIGLPNSMIKISKTPRKVSTVNLIYCPVGAHYHDSNDFIEVGIKVLSVINTLELNGIRVKLQVSFNCAKDNNTATLGTVSLKGYQEKLNLLKICFPIAHPSFLRRIGFKWIETVPNLNESGYAIGYGTTVKDTSIFKKSTNAKILLFESIKDLTEEEIMQQIISN